jgi:hypothetical protein
VVGALALVCAITATGVITGTVIDRLAHGHSSSGVVPDTLLQMVYDQQARQEYVVAYLPGTRTPYPLLDDGSNPLISPDGDQVFFTQRQLTADGVQYAVVAFASDTLAQAWRSVVVTGPAGTQQTLSTEVTHDHVYIASHRWQSSEPVTIVAFDRADGREQARWSVDLAGQEASGISLRAAPDGGSLALMVNLQSGTGLDVVPKSLFLRFHLPDAREIERMALSQTGDNGLYWLGGAATPDGNTLYQLGYGNSETNLVLRFFDLHSEAALPSLAIPFAGSGPFFLAYEQAISHDGQRLYVLAPSLRSLVVVNLMTRSIEDRVQLDAGAVTSASGAPLFARVLGSIGGLFGQHAAAKGPILGAMQFSPDGRTLYAAGIKGEGYSAGSRGVWVIDTHSWRVWKQWLADASPTALLLSGDGRFLSVADSDGGLHTLDTTSGNELFTARNQAGGNTYAQTLSLTELYRQRYGKSPNLGAPAPAVRAPLPFAALTASVNTSAVIAGDTVTIEARFTDPTSGLPITPRMHGIHYAPPVTVTAAFCLNHMTACEPRIPLTNTAYGVYRGSAMLMAAGQHTVQVAAIWDRDDLPNRQITVENAVTVQPAFTGTDGRRYIAMVGADPEQPIAKREATLRVVFVDAARKTPLPDGVELFGGLPKLLNLDCVYGDGGGYSLVPLTAVGHGIYAGPAILWMPGNWRIGLQAPVGNGVVSSVPIGAIRVASST